MTTAPAPLDVRSGQGTYRVTFEDSVAGAVAPFAADERNVFLIDATVRDLYAAAFDSVAPQRLLTLEATEANKTLEGVAAVATFLQDANASKASQLVIAGGGIVQDVGAFAAHIYYRGIPYAFLPTTLLAMSDSCIGAKCGLNHGRFKNQLGFFASPKAVAIAPEFLGTLPAGDVRSGLGEILKLALTEGEDAYAAYAARLDRDGLGLDGIATLIRRSLETKRAVIEVDEYESGLRKTLNYGHTFGHALETVTANAVSHGLAVAWGVDIANFFARELGLLDARIFERVHALAAKHFSFDMPPAFDEAAFVAAMRRDKKAAGSSVALILLRDYGRLEIVPTPFDDAFAGLVNRYVREWSIAR